MKSSSKDFASRMFKVLFGTLGVLSGLLMTGSAWGNTWGQDTYETHCVSCHGPEGRGSLNGDVPRINGQHAVVIVKQILDIRALNRNIPEMEPFAMPDVIGDEDDLYRLALHIASFPKENVENGKGPGDNLALGEQLYRDNCSQCHGENGEGSNNFAVPRVGGQHYDYMYRQFQKVRFGQRYNMIRPMRDMVLEFSEEERKAVLDYTSRLSGESDEATGSGTQQPSQEVHRFMH